MLRYFPGHDYWASSCAQCCTRPYSSDEENTEKVVCLNVIISVPSGVYTFIALTFEPLGS